MKYFKILFIITLAVGLTSCKKDRYPEFENSANAQFTRSGDRTATGATYNTLSFSKAAPATTDAFLLKVIESGNVQSVSVMVDYRKAATPSVVSFTQKYDELTAWPKNYTTSLNALATLFAANGITVANLAVGDQFIFRIVVTLKSGTVISGQAAVLNTAPYAITLTYKVAA